VLEQLGVTDAVTLAEAAILCLDHPRWAVWRPVDGSGWAAVRPAGRRPPGPEVPMLWVRICREAEGAPACGCAAPVTHAQIANHCDTSTERAGLHGPRPGRSRT
jgi:hypothetical protein